MYRVGPELLESLLASEPVQTGALAACKPAPKASPAQSGVLDRPLQAARIHVLNGKSRERIALEHEWTARLVDHDVGSHVAKVQCLAAARRRRQDLPPKRYLSAEQAHPSIRMVRDDIINEERPVNAPCRDVHASADRALVQVCLSLR